MQGADVLDSCPGGVTDALRLASPWPSPLAGDVGLTCLRMASRSWSCTRSSRRWIRVRRVLRGSEKRLKKLSCGSKLQAALTSSTYLGGKGSLASGRGSGAFVLPQGSALALLLLKPSLATHQQRPSLPTPVPLSNSICLDPDRPAGDMKMLPQA